MILSAIGLGIVCFVATSTIPVTTAMISRAL